MAARLLMILSASILLNLGTMHLVYTFWGTSLAPRDPALQVSMSNISPILTGETTMWRCWVGFNASHSMGLILFGLIYGYLALAHDQLLFRSPFPVARRASDACESYCRLQALLLQRSPGRSQHLFRVLRGQYCAIASPKTLYDGLRDALIRLQGRGDLQDALY